MIVYHAITTYHILKCAIHKLWFHSDEKAIILLPEFIARVPDGLQNKKWTIFDDVVYFDWERRMLPEDKDDKNHYINYIDEVLEKSFGKDFWERVSEINVCRAEYFFGIYLCSQNRKFQWFEDADGRFSNPQPIINNDLKWKLRSGLALELGLYTGSNDCVTKKFINFAAQVKPVADSLAENFNISKLLLELDIISQKKLLDFFGVSHDIHFDSPSALFLTQHFTNLRMLTFEEHALCYQLTTDYFLDGYNLYYKWHPSDRMPYEDFMNDVKMISGDFPSELLALIIKKKIGISASISSTGVYNLKDISEKILTFTEDYLQSFMQNHIYYFCAKLAELLSSHKITAIGMNHSQLLNMLDFGVKINNPQVKFCDAFPDIPERANTLYLIGNSDIISEGSTERFFVSANENDVFVFLNQGSENYFMCLLHRFPTVVKEINNASENSEELERIVFTNRVFIFTKNDEYRRVIEQMKYIKLLLNTGVRTFVDDKQNKDARIAALEGMLKATEESLEKCCKENEELKAELITMKHDRESNIEGEIDKP